MRTALVFLFALLSWVVTPSTPPALAAPVPKSLKHKSDADLLEGRWVRVSLDGGSGPKPDTSRWMEVKDGKITSGSSDGSEPRTQATFTIATDQSPKQIDVAWSHFNTAMKYIYRLDDDTLTWCHAQDGQPRPAEFKGGDGRYCLVYRREKSKE